VKIPSWPANLACHGDERALPCHVDFQRRFLARGAQRHESSALRRSSSFVDQAAAAGQMPVTALINMTKVVVSALQ
jgi:hypothetical protein